LTGLLGHRLRVQLPGMLGSIEGCLSPALMSQTALHLGGLFVQPDRLSMLSQLAFLRLRGSLLSRRRPA